MNFVEAIKSGFSNYVNFSGRAQRSAYWWWVLFGILVSIITAGIDATIFGYGFSPLNWITGLILLLPGIAVSVRRMHDRDYSGWWLLIAFTGIGIILLLVWFCMRGTVGSNRFGPDPLGSM